jgi:preprotein translocase subunit Sec61beta
MNDDTLLGPVAVGALIAVLVVMAHLLAGVLP